MEWPYSLAYQGPWIENKRQDKEKEKRKDKTKQKKRKKKKKMQIHSWMYVSSLFSSIFCFCFVLFLFDLLFSGMCVGVCVCFVFSFYWNKPVYIYIDICDEGSQWDTYLSTFSQMILILSLSKWRWWRMSLSIYSVIVADNRSTLALINVLLSLPSSLNSGRNLPLWKICNMQINWVAYILKVVSELQKMISNGNAFWICENFSQKDCETNDSDFF